MDVRTRYAPSPTGEPHIGNIRTMIFAWLTARHAGGKFFLRIEDTDQERYVPGSARSIVESLRWLGVDMRRLWLPLAVSNAVFAVIYYAVVQFGFDQAAKL